MQRSMTIFFRVAIVFGLLLTQTAFSQDSSDKGRGQGFRGGGGQGVGRGMGRGMQGGGGPHAMDDRHEADHEVFQYLLTNHDKIKRTVKELSDGVETLTESENPEVAAKIKDHVEWMEYRIEKNHPIRMRDPIFAEIFKHTDKIKMVREETEKGVRVTETSDDPYVAKLIHAHAKVLTGFVERGFAEAMKNHAVPGQKPGVSKAASQTKISGFGKVVQLPNAAQQPRDGAKLVIDITRGSDPAKLNAAIEKVAKYLNIYAAAGEKPASAQIAVVLHGESTLAVLNADAYSTKFKTKGNPNLDLLHQLHEAGVDLYVCGQSLIAEGHQPTEVVVFVDTAVSALTAIVNFQADGYSYVPLAD